MERDPIAQCPPARSARHAPACEISQIGVIIYPLVNTMVLRFCPVTRWAEVKVLACHAVVDGARMERCEASVASGISATPDTWGIVKNGRDHTATDATDHHCHIVELCGRLFRLPLFSRSSVRPTLWLKEKICLRQRADNLPGFMFELKIQKSRRTVQFQSRGAVFRQVIVIGS